MQSETAIFGGGCFWCVEAVFSSLKGVISVSSGYSGGEKENSTYEEVCSGATDHAEVVKIGFDPEIISFEDLLAVFFATHDPTTPDRQGDDVGTQYRSIIFYTSEAQKELAEKYIINLDKEKIFPHPVVTKIAPQAEFYKAESYHQKYFDNNRQAPYCQFIINPKIDKLREKYKKFLKE